MNQTVEFSVKDNIHGPYYVIELPKCTCGSPSKEIIMYKFPTYEYGICNDCKRVLDWSFVDYTNIGDLVEGYTEDNYEEDYYDDEDDEDYEE